MRPGAHGRRRPASGLVDAVASFHPTIGAVTHEKESVRAAAVDRVPVLFIPVRPVEPLQIAKRLDVNAGLDLPHLFGHVVLRTRGEGRLDKCSALGRLARFPPNQVVGEEAGRGHRRTERSKGHALEECRFSGSVAPEHEIHVRQLQPFRLRGGRHVRMDEVDGRLLERPECSHDDRVDVHDAPARCSQGRSRSRLRTV